MYAGVLNLYLTNNKIQLIFKLSILPHCCYKIKNIKNSLWFNDNNIK
jgi:hypothetical protein